MRRMERTLRMPEGTLTRTLRMEFAGNRRVVVEGCRRILQYDEDRITLDTVEGAVAFEGELLCVNCLAGDSAVVSGGILTVSFKEL